MLSKIGFFHFGQNHSQPIEELWSALKTTGKEAVRKSLIVLPEGFNLCKFYGDNNTACKYDRSVLFRLSDIAAAYETVFLAGLIIDDNNGVDLPPYNSAYLIDPNSDPFYERICSKRGRDAMCYEPHHGDVSGTKNYRACSTRCNERNPVDSRGTSIATIICLDVQLSSDCNTLMDQMKGPGIICIPACMDHQWKVETLARDWRDNNVVLANSHSLGCESFIADSTGKVIKKIGGSENKVCVIELA
jgi:predicted amidohydrolase